MRPPPTAPGIRDFIRNRFSLRDNALWRVVGLLRPVRRQIILANVLMILASSLAGLGLISLRPLFAVGLSRAPAEAAAVEPSGSALEEAGTPSAASQGGSLERAEAWAERYMPAARPLAARAGEIWGRSADWARASLSRFVAVYCLLILGIFVLHGLFQFLGDYLMERASIRVTSQLMQDLYTQALRQELQYFHGETTGSLLNTCYRSAFQIRPMIKLLASTRVMLPANALILFITLLVINYRLTLLLGLLLPFVILPTLMLTRWLRQALRAEVELEEGALDVMTEGFRGVQAIKAFGAERLESDYLRPAVDQLVRSSRRRRAAEAVTGPFVDVLNIATLLAVFLIATFAFPDTLRFEQGRLLVFLFATTRFYKPFRTLMSMNIKMQRAATVARRVFALLDRQPRIVEAADPLPFPATWRELIFENVSLTYVIRRRKRTRRRPALRDVSFRVRRGEAVALVGPNGAGKTSIVHLLTRLYEPSAGMIRIDDTPIHRLRLRQLREKVCLITQQPFLFNRSVAENIAFGLEGLSRERIVEAAQATQAHRFISALPQGYDTLVGEQGALLSGGERQKVALTRAFVRRPEILILDEPTAALDQETKREFIELISRLNDGGLTVIFITHEYGSLGLFDRVLRMTEDRSVAEEEAAALARSGTFSDAPVAGDQYPA